VKWIRQYLTAYAGLWINFGMSAFIGGVAGGITVKVIEWFFE